MNKKMKPCKTCGHEIAKNAKKCPNCGEPNKKKHPVLTILLVLLVLFIIVGSTGDDDEPVHVNPTGPASEITSTTPSITSKDKKATFAPGETAELRGVSTTLVQVTESNGSAYNQPTDGNIFVICEFEIENNSDYEIVVSSMLSFEAYCDDYACTYSLSAILEKENKNQLDGTVAPGKKFNGVIGFEVPEDWKELEVHFTPDTWSSKDIVFIATND